MILFENDNVVRIEIIKDRFIPHVIILLAFRQDHPIEGCKRHWCYEIVFAFYACIREIGCGLIQDRQLNRYAPDEINTCIYDPGIV